MVFIYSILHNFIASCFTIFVGFLTIGIEELMSYYVNVIYYFLFRDCTNAKAKVSAPQNESETINRFTIVRHANTDKRSNCVSSSERETNIETSLVVKVKVEGFYFTISSKTRQSPTQEARESRWFWQKWKKRIARFSRVIEANANATTSNKSDTNTDATWTYSDEKLKTVTHMARQYIMKCTSICSRLRQWWR